MLAKSRTQPLSKREALSPANLQLILEMISKVTFGSVTVIIQDGKVIQIDRKEKLKVV